MKIVLASHNQKKLIEFEKILGSYSLSNINFALISNYSKEEPVEDGSSFQDNALIKAKFASELSNHIALSDDSGFCVEAIDNQPGIYSARWAPNNDYDIAFKKIQELMKDNKNTNARFVCTLCLYIPKELQSGLILPKNMIGNYAFFTGEIQGDISFPANGTNGFAYDTIFTPKGYKHTFAQMESNEKNSLSHRFLAIQQFINQFLIPNKKENT